MMVAARPNGSCQTPAQYGAGMAPSKKEESKTLAEHPL